MRTAARWMLILTLLSALMGSTPIGEAAAGNAHAPALQSTAVTMTSPSACPYAGCAAGQRLNMRFDFEPSAYNRDLDPNIKMCVYAPSGWNVPTDSVTVDSTGEVTGKTYVLPDASDTGCTQDSEPPAGYSLIAERVTRLDANTFADALGFGFRIGASGAGGGRVLARLFARSAEGTWARVQQASSTTLKLVNSGSHAYVASDPNTCATAQPCYVNSGDDLEGGIGTGLKDAVDAAPDTGAVVTVLSTYTIKSYTVAVNRPLTLNGLGDSRITYNESVACDRGPMLSLNSQVTLRDLTITDGACSSPNRTLVQVNSTSPVTIRDSDLTGGEDAIYVVDNPGADGEDKIVIRANAITGNRSYAVRIAGSASGAPVEITANNLNGNRAGAPVDCAEGASGAVSNRVANHNYWGSSTPTSDETHCVIDAAKRLGMPAALEPYKPGLRVRQVSVTSSKVYNSELDDQIAYRHTGDGSFNLFIVDHGYASPSGPPFTFAMGLESPSPCSNAWDIFLPEGGSITGDLELSFKYDRTAACQATINSNQYCDQTANPEKYPLYWLDPRQSTPKWITTGSKIDSNTAGQTTICNTGGNEITVSIDSSGRPSVDDLGYAPFMVGVPVISKFLPLASSQTVTVTWGTNNEPDVVGFYVLRGTSATQLSPISDLIAHRGTALVGISDYRFVDAGRVNNTTYYYRLQVLRADGTSIYSSIFPITANFATITPTPTKTNTFTPRPTLTRAPTLVRTSIPTRVPTSTLAFRTITPRPTNTLFLRTNTPTLDMSLPGAQFTATSIARTSVALRNTLVIPTRITVFGGTTTPGVDLTGTLTAEPETTTTPTPSVTASPSSTAETTRVSSGTASEGEADPWLSLLLGILAGLAAAGSVGGAWYYLRLKH